MPGGKGTFPGLSVGESSVEAVVVVETLKEQIPEGDQRGKEAVVEGFVFKRRQLAQGALGKQLEEEAQQLGRGKAGLGVAGLWLKGVFLDGI